MASRMPQIAACDVTNCAYNQNKQCHTMAITVGGPGEECACCDTFFNESKKGGSMDLSAGVGACKVDQCTFNQSFECSAPNIKVGLHQGHADCTTYRPR